MNKTRSNKGPAEAAKIAQQLVADTLVASDERISKQLTTALRDIFGEHQASGRFIDVTRIPLLCKSVIDTNTRLGKIEEKLDNKFVTIEAFTPVRSIVFGLVGTILFAVIGAVLMLVVK